MPIVASMGGIAGSQTLTIVVRGLALGRVGTSNALPLLTKEVSVGSLNGILWSVVIGIIAVLWFDDFRLGAIIAAAIVVNLVVGHILMSRFPDTSEGDLSRMRASLVNEARLAAVARSLELGTFVQLGKGEENTQGRDKNSILADTLEAVVAAVYLDGGLDAAYQLIETHLAPQLDTIHTSAANRDYKSQLQERLQERRKWVG